MNELITDPGLRNWIKACVGLKCVRDGMLPFMERKCEDLYSNNETFTQKITKLTTYSCSVCCVKDVQPSHSMKICPAKGKTKCACTSKNKKLCPNGGACGVMYDRIMEDHVNMTPRWDNSDCQKWYLNGWEQMKCFIDIPGYKEKALISQADVTAFVHICQNNKTLCTIFKSHLGKLLQVRSDRNEIYHSGDLVVTDDKLKEYFANMQAVLKIVVFNAFTTDIQEQLDKLAKLEADVGIEVNTVTEIEARKEALNALIEDTRTLEERNANTPDDNPEASIQQAQYAVLQDTHMRSIADHLKRIKEEFNLCAKVLLEQSSDLKSITAGVHANTKAFETLQKELVQQSELIRGIEVTTVDTNIVVTKTYRTLKDVECDVKTILLIFNELIKYIRPHARNINGTVVAEIKGVPNEKHLSNEIVQAMRSRKFNPDQEANSVIDNALMEDIIKAVETDGDEIIDVRPGSIIIKILCPSMSNWINMCEQCIDGRMTQRFKPLQDHLRKNTSLANLTITVDMLETDFIESVDTIVKQLYPHMIAVLPHNLAMHRQDGNKHSNVQDLNAMLKCLLDKSYQSSHQKPCSDIQIPRAHRIEIPEMQIDSGQTTLVSVDHTCMETKTDQNKTPATSKTLSVQTTVTGTHTESQDKMETKTDLNETPLTSETLSVQTNFKGTHTDPYVTEDATLTEVEADNVTQPNIKQSSHDIHRHMRKRHSVGSMSIASVLRESPMNSVHLLPMYGSLSTDTEVTPSSSTSRVSRTGSTDSGNDAPHVSEDETRPRKTAPAIEKGTLPTQSKTSRMDRTGKTSDRGRGKQDRRDSRDYRNRRDGSIDRERDSRDKRNRRDGSKDRERDSRDNRNKRDGSIDRERDSRDNRNRRDGSIDRDRDSTRRDSDSRDNRNRRDGSIEKERDCMRRDSDRRDRYTSNSRANSSGSDSEEYDLRGNDERYRHRRDTSYSPGRNRRLSTDRDCSRERRESVEERYSSERDRRNESGNTTYTRNSDRDCSYTDRHDAKRTERKNSNPDREKYNNDNRDRIPKDKYRKEKRNPSNRDTYTGQERETIIEGNSRENEREKDPKDRKEDRKKPNDRPPSRGSRGGRPATSNQRGHGRGGQNADPDQYMSAGAVPQQQQQSPYNMPPPQHQQSPYTSHPAQQQQVLYNISLPQQHQLPFNMHPAQQPQFPNNMPLHQQQHFPFNMPTLQQQPPRQVFMNGPPPVQHMTQFVANGHDDKAMETKKEVKLIQDVFKFIVKTFDGSGSPDDIRRESGLFPTDFDVSDWFKKKKQFAAFEKDGKVISVTVCRKDITYCFNYFKRIGCADENCRRFHVCKDFLCGHCYFGEKCNFKHNVTDKQNAMAARKYGLDNFTNDEIICILKRRYPHVCKEWVKTGTCPASICNDLHVCPGYINGKCQEENCPKIHDRKSSHNGPIVNAYGLDYKNDETYFRQAVYLVREPEVAAVVEENTDLLKTDIAGQKSICTAFLVDDCKKRGCKQIHSDRPYIWQVKLWDEWRAVSHQETVEELFSRPDKTATNQIAYNELTGDGRSATFNIMFEPLRATCIDPTGQTTTYEVRRLSTKSFAFGKANGSEPFRTEWRWYLELKPGEWLLMEQDSFQLTVETKYLDRQDSYLYTRENFKLKYQLNLDRMEQIDLATQVSRNIRRRPLFVSANDVEQQISPGKLLATPLVQVGPPPGWVPWDHFQPFEWVKLSSVDDDYKQVSENFYKTLDPNKQIIDDIYRVQNHVLWSTFSNHLERVMKPKKIRLGDPSGTVTTLDLYHGTDNMEAVRGISINNFDSRTSGKNMTRFGDGAYFATDAKYAHEYTKGPHRLMFQARVLVGEATEGKPEYRRPPDRPGMDHELYDSCVDVLKDPRIYVLFEKAQCYPEFLIHYHSVGDLKNTPAQDATELTSCCLL